MNDLININYENSDRPTVMGRDLHAALVIKTSYKDWFPRMCEYGFTEGEDFNPLKNEQVRIEGNRQVSREVLDHQLTIGMAKEICMIQRTDIGRKIRKYFIDVENRYKKNQQLSPIEMIAGIANNAVEMERRQKMLEVKQQEQAVKIDDTNRRLDNMVDVLTLDKNSWRHDSKHLISKIAQTTGSGFDCIGDTYKEVYRLVEERAGVSLGTRLTNKRNRMAGEGVCKSKRDRLSKVDVIADDKKLIEIYVAIVKEMAVKYGVAV